MKLLAPRVLASLTAVTRDKASSVEARQIAESLIPKIHRAEKFLFDSGMDRDGDTCNAFRETAVNMLEAGIFHLPFPETWIEDPFSDGEQAGQSRYMYLCEEDQTTIRIWFFSDLQDQIVSLPYPLLLDKTNPSDEFFYPPENPQNAAFYRVAGEAIYAVKKFIVTLGTRGTERERVKGGNHALNLKPRARNYPHTVVRIPTDYSSPVEGGGGGRGGYRRMHIVRGYTWGKNTRPLTEQRWIEPFFRGRAELGEVEHNRYEVRAPTKGVVA